MIHAIRCNHPGFKNVELTSGLNVVLAERTKDSTKKGSRNGLGKSTLIEIIHFCLGSSANSSPLLDEPLQGWTFSLDLDLRGARYTVSRNTETPGRVFLEGNCEDWPIKPQTDTESGKLFMSVNDWNAALGWLMFDLGISIHESKYVPRFRSLISYFIRRGKDAFSIPFEHYRKQKEWDIQVHNLFLLGLDWDYAQKWQALKDKEVILEKLKEAAKTGIVSDITGTIGELEATKVRIEEQVAAMQSQLANFKVHPQYSEIEAQANALTAQIHELSNSNVMDRRMADFYESSFREEHPADQSHVAKTYAELELELPDRIVKRIEEVQDFHQRIVANRASFLKGEIDRLNRSIAERDERVRAASEERAALLAILQTHGALEEYGRLQQLLTDRVSQLDEVKGKIGDLRKFERGKSAVRIEREQVYMEARSDYDERSPIRDQAISRFNANSEALYEAPGKLIIDVKPTGFNFHVEIERSSSQGFEEMKVFCYDLMLAQLWSAKTVSPQLLIHDSPIFDGVDERQVALALQLAASESEKRGFQYICCLNSDMVPWQDFDENFDLRKHVRLELTDTHKDGGLLGIRY